MNVRTLNPVLDRELRQRSRSRRWVIMMSAYLGLLTLVLYISFKGAQEVSQFSGDPLSALTTSVGRGTFEWVVATQLTLLLFLVPGISAGAIAGERDRQTLIPLQVTLLSPSQIFFGKVASSVSFVLLLIVAALPIMAVPYLVGGISLGQILAGLVMLLATGVILTTIGVGCSAIFRRTQTATLSAYAMTLALVIGSLLSFAVLAVIDGTRGTDEVEFRMWPLYANPYVGMADAAGDIGFNDVGPLSPIKTGLVETQLSDNQFRDGNVVIDGNTGNVIDVDLSIKGPPVWLRSLLTQGLVAVLFAGLGIRRLRAPSRQLHD